MSQVRWVVVGIALLVAFVQSPVARAWDQHQVIMQTLARTSANLNRKYLYEKVQIPSLAEEKTMIQTLAQGLELNANAIPIYNNAHPGLKEVEIYELFRSEMVDEPDLGMDQDLPDSADPKGDRTWMGGKTGPTSQGFRHMYFGGMDYTQPIQTLQYPFRAMGQAPVRYQKLVAMSDKFFQENQKFWGVRTLLWALHYLQDLHQPFHVVQIPNLRFLPILDLFNGFVARTTQTIANYHYAYEGLALTYLTHADETSFKECLDVSQPLYSENLAEIIQKVKDETRFMSVPLYELLGPSLKQADVDLVRGVGKPDYFKIITSTSGENPMKLRQVTCRLYQSVAQYSWGLFDRAFNYAPDPSRKRGR